MNKNMDSLKKRSSLRCAAIPASLLALCMMCGTTLDTYAVVPRSTGNLPVLSASDDWADEDTQQSDDEEESDDETSSQKSSRKAKVVERDEEDPPTVKAKKSTDGASGSTATKEGGNYAKMLEWQKKNSDVMGYLSIAGTNIDYPVVKGATNNTYMQLGYDKKYSYNGVIWADQDVSAKSKNTILYGHNWTNFSANPRIGNANDVMFAQLTAYQHASFAKEHPTIQYANANGNATWVVFATSYTKDLNFYINANASPVALAKKAKELSVNSFDVDVKDSDTILTLSTCTRYFGSFENQRFVVMARKLRPGEKAPAPVSSEK